MESEIFPSPPGGMALSEETAEQSHPGDTFSILSVSSPWLITLKVCLMTSPCLTSQNSNFRSIRDTSGPFFSCARTEKVDAKIKNSNNKLDNDHFFILPSSMIGPPYLSRGNQWVVFRQIFTSMSITGTSISTPTTVARAAPEESPKSMVDVAMATSKWLDAPIMAAGAASR